MLNKQGIDIKKIQHIKEDILNYKNYLNQYLCHFLDNLHTVLKEELGIESSDMEFVKKYKEELNNNGIDSKETNNR